MIINLVSGVKQVNVQDIKKLHSSLIYTISPKFSYQINRQMYQRKRRHIGNRSKYTKVPIKTKLKFLRKVILEGFSIKDSSTIFNINYSTAKTLIGQYKNKSFGCNLSAFTDETDMELEECKLKRCTYKDIQVEVDDKMEHSTPGQAQFYLCTALPLDQHCSRLKVVSQLHHNKITIISSTTTH